MAPWYYSHEPSAIKLFCWSAAGVSKRGTPVVKRTRHFYEARARVAKALSQASRPWILDALREKERCVCGLTRLVGADPSTVSKHLAVRKNAGIVGDRKVGLSARRTSTH